jgi:hypothetical protein
MKIQLAFYLCVAPVIAIADDAGRCPDTQSDLQKIEFNQKVTAGAVNAFIDKYTDCIPAWITVTSSGGDAEAAMLLGDWIFKNRINIRVRSLCVSSCANYIFPAGRQKEIEPRALIVWHGSALQKNFREFISKYEAIQATDNSSPYLAENSLNYNSLLRIIKKQNEFFAKIGVDESILRLGQEPFDFDTSGWSATPQVMKKYGINNISAPTNYGELSYFHALFGLKYLFKGKFMSFTIGSTGEIAPIPKEEINSLLESRR